MVLQVWRFRVAQTWPRNWLSFHVRRLQLQASITLALARGRIGWPFESMLVMVKATASLHQRAAKNSIEKFLS